MSGASLATAHRLLLQAVDALGEAAGLGSDAELMSVLTLCEGATRRLDRVTVDALAALERRGVFAERGYKSAAAALSDLLAGSGSRPGGGSWPPSRSPRAWGSTGRHWGLAFRPPPRSSLPGRRRCGTSRPSPGSWVRTPRGGCRPSSGPGQRP